MAADVKRISLTFSILIFNHKLIFLKKISFSFITQHSCIFQ